MRRAIVATFGAVLALVAVAGVGLAQQPVPTLAVSASPTTVAIRAPGPVPAGPTRFEVTREGNKDVSVYFFLLNTAKLPAYWGVHMFTRDVLWLSLYTLPLVVAGALFGFWINRKMNDALFSKIVYVLTFALGWWLLYDGARDLMG